MKVVTRMVMAGLLAAAACGGGDDDGSTPDRRPIDIPDAAAGLPDAMGQGTPDAEGPHVCLTEATYGAATFMNQQAAADVATMANTMQFLGTLNADQTPDAFALELYKGYGAFMTGEIRTGTFTITGPELNYATCGVCPRVFTDYDTTAMTFADQQYYATGGTVVISTISPNLSGQVSNLTFNEVTINSSTFMSTPVPGGCETMIMSGSFDTPVTVM